jgi:hypothetical protein
LVVLAVEGSDGRLCLGVGIHFDKAESLAATGFAVADDLSGCDSPVRGEKFLQLGAVHLITQVANIQLLTHSASPVLNRE